MNNKSAFVASRKPSFYVRIVKSEDIQLVDFTSAVGKEHLYRRSVGAEAVTVYLQHSFKTRVG